MTKSSVFFKLSKLPLKRVSAIEIDGVRTASSFVALTKDNIYFNNRKIPLSEVVSVIADDNFVQLSANVRLEFRSSKMKLHLRSRKLTASQYAELLVKKYCSVNNALSVLAKQNFPADYKNDVERYLHSIGLNGDIL